MTESSPVTHFTPRFNKKLGSAGLLIPNTEAKIVDTETGARFVLFAFRRFSVETDLEDSSLFDSPMYSIGALFRQCGFRAWQDGGALYQGPAGALYSL